jgi:hypothetical protein
MQIDGGTLWGEIRSGLSMYRERLVQAYGAGNYEREAAVLDDVARRIVDRVEQRVEGNTREASGE